MKELIERVEAIFGELGYDIFDKEEHNTVYQASFGKDDEIFGTFFIEDDNNFLEIANTYTFDADEEEFLKEHLEDMMNICYEYGNYFNIVKEEDEIDFSVFSKVYYSGLNLESLEDTLDDFINCNRELISILDLEEDE